MKSKCRRPFPHFPILFVHFSWPHPHLPKDPSSFPCLSVSSLAVDTSLHSGLWSHGKLPVCVSVFAEKDIILGWDMLIPMLPHLNLTNCTWVTTQTLFPKGPVHRSCVKCNCWIRGIRVYDLDKILWCWTFSQNVVRCVAFCLCSRLVLMLCSHTSHLQV